MTRQRLFDLLDQGALAGGAGAAIQYALTILVLISLVALVAGAEADSAGFSPAVLGAVEAAAMAALVADAALRFALAGENRRFARAGRLGAALRYALTADGIIDLLALAPWLVRAIWPQERPLFLALALLRCLKLVRYSRSLRSLMEALGREQKSLMACLVVTAIVAVIGGGAMDYLESAGQPDDFGSLAKTIWWSAETIIGASTDEAEPDSALGKLVNSILSISGFLLLALPMGIIASSFESSYRRRDFLVTWNMVADVPLFKALNAREVAHLADALRSEIFAPGETIVRRGEMGDCMYFIVSGEVGVETQAGPVTLASGAYFGEMALIRSEPRVATVRALSRTRLLTLAKQGLERVIEARPEILADIRAMIAARDMPTPSH